MLLWVSVYTLHETEVRVEALDSEETVHEGVEEPLVKVVVNSSSVDALREEGTQGTPRDLVRGKVCSTLYIREAVITLVMVAEY